MIIDDLRRADPAPDQDVPIPGVPDADLLLAMIDERNQPMATTQLDRPDTVRPSAPRPRRRLVAAAAAFVVALIAAAIALNVFSPGDDVAESTLSSVDEANIGALAVEWSSGDLARFNATIAPGFAVTSGPVSASETLDQLRFDIVVGQQIEFFECEKVFAVSCQYRASNDLLSAASQLQPIQADGVRLSFDEAGLVTGFSANVGLEPMRAEWADFVRWLEERAPEDAALMGEWHTRTISQSPQVLGPDVAAVARQYFDEYAGFLSGG